MKKSDFIVQLILLIVVLLGLIMGRYEICIIDLLLLIFNQLFFNGRD